MYFPTDLQCSYTVAKVTACKLWCMQIYCCDKTKPKLFSKNHNAAMLQVCFIPSLIASPAQDTSTTSAPQQPALGYLTRPANVTAALGDPAVFRCGVPDASPNVTFTFYGSRRNYSLFCPTGSVEDIPQVRQFPDRFHLRNRNVVGNLGVGKDVWFNTFLTSSFWTCL